MFVYIAIGLVGTFILAGPNELYARGVAPILVEGLDEGSPSLAEAIREEGRRTTPSDLGSGEAAKEQQQ